MRYRVRVIHVEEFIVEAETPSEASEKGTRLAQDRAESEDFEVIGVSSVSL